MRSYRFVPIFSQKRVLFLRHPVYFVHLTDFFTAVKEQKFKTQLRQEQICRSILPQVRIERPFPLAE